MSLPTYLGVPVLNWQPDWSDPSRVMRLVQAKNVLGVDGPGPLKYDSPHQPRPRTGLRLRYVLETRDEMNDARDFIRDTAQGRRLSFWVPLWSQALHLSTAMGSGDTSMVITRCGYARDMAGEGRGREHVAVFNGATLVARKVTAATEGDTTETLTLSSAFGVALPLGSYITYLLYCRMDTDTPVLQWASMHTGILEVPLIDLPIQTP